MSHQAQILGKEEFQSCIYSADMNYETLKFVSLN